MSRTHASSELPKVKANMIVVWLPDADPRDVEESIKQTAREAINKYRDAI